MPIDISLFLSPYVFIPISSITFSMKHVLCIPLPCLSSIFLSIIVVVRVLFFIMCPVHSFAFQFQRIPHWFLNVRPSENLITYCFLSIEFLTIVSLTMFGKLLFCLFSAFGIIKSLSQTEILFIRLFSVSYTENVLKVRPVIESFLLFSLRFLVRRVTFPVACVFNLSG